MRIALTFLVAGFVVASCHLQTFANNGPSGQAPLNAADPTQLVQLLGNASFSVRERATVRLIRCGVAAMPMLRNCLKSDDRETRFRSQRVLDIILADDFQRRLQAFATGANETQDYDLPCWKSFGEQFGRSRESRFLFVEMQKAESNLLKVLDDSPSKAGETLAIRVGQIQRSVQVGGRATRVPLGSIAAFLFVILNQERNFPVQVTQYITSLLQQPAFRSALQDGEQRETLRKMLGKWILRSHGWAAYHGVLLSIQYDLPEGLIAAKRILQDGPAMLNQPYYRYYALVAVGKFGSEEEIPLAERFLTDTTPYGVSVTVNRNTKARTQIRDVALVVLLHLTKQDPIEFGFKRMRSTPSTDLDPGALVFEDDAKREAALKMWKAFRTKHGK